MVTILHGGRCGPAFGLLTHDQCKALPELPDVEAYLWALRDRMLMRRIESVRLRSPFLVRTFEPSFDHVEGRLVTELSRIGKRLVLRLETNAVDHAHPTVWMVVHLMIAGRLRWGKPGAGLPGRMGLCAFDLEHGTLILTEASRKKRASIHLVVDEQGLETLNPGGPEIADLDADGFAAALTRKNHTLKRALTDPRLLSGIGGAYADEIMHRARVSPVKWTSRLEADELQRLYDSSRKVLRIWTERLIQRAEAGSGWPTITAFQDGMAVHGRFGEPCPVCGDPVQRIVYASNETNYCATCQTGGKLLADRSLSRLLKKDWPRSLEELEELKPGSARSKPPL